MATTNGRRLKNEQKGSSLNGAYLRALPNQFTAYATKAQHPVIPAQAGIQRFLRASWIPACAGMTKNPDDCLK
jgi:hypothetical protein